MNNHGLFAAHHVALVYDWLTELGELFVRLEYPHSGGSGSDFLVRSFEDLRDLLSRQTVREIEINVFRAVVFPIRGNDYSALLQRALREIPDGRYYQIRALPPHARESRSLRLYECECLAGGNSHDELRHDFANLEPGREIAIGVHPFDESYEVFERFYGRPVEHLFIAARFEIHHNLDQYDEYSRNPARYQAALKQWYRQAAPERGV